jgi:Tfp pilus assembly protein PilV
MKIRSHRGATLVEVLVATIIFSLALTALLGSMVAINDLLDLNRERSQATLDLKSMLERVRATPFSNIITRFPNGTVDGPGLWPYSSIVGNYTLRAQHITVTFANPNTDPLEIKTTLTWLDKQGRNRNASMATFRTR